LRDDHGGSFIPQEKIMTHRKIIVGLVAAAMGFASVASFAQPRPGPDRRGAMHGGPGAGPMRGPQRRMGPAPRRMAAAPGFPEYRRFNRGERLPPQYRSNQYVVNDWRGHHLSAPPRGYQWVQNGSDYVLAAVATGVIASVIANALSQ
jgi:Ni/Co efflux regulator RcnB